MDAEQVTNVHLFQAATKGSHLLLSKDRRNRGVGQMPCDTRDPNIDKRAFFEPEKGHDIFMEGQKLELTVWLFVSWGGPSYCHAVSGVQRLPA